MATKKENKRQRENKIGTQQQTGAVTWMVRNFEEKSVTFPSNRNSVSHQSGNLSTQIDAKPSASINLNYQSPYRNSAVYKRSTTRTVQEPTPSLVTSPIQNANQAPVLQRPSLEPLIPKSSIRNDEPDTNTTSLCCVPCRSQCCSDAYAQNTKLVVTKTGQFYDGDGDSPLPIYQTHSKKRGEALIINNFKFNGKGHRQGTKEDDKKLRHLFEQIGFKVNVERNLTKAKMESKLRNFTKKKSLKSADISLVVVMSQGTGATTHGNTEVLGTDGNAVSVDDILENFNENSCKAMRKKPKIFIFQCYSRDTESTVEHDHKPPSKHVVADALIAHCTVFGLEFEKRQRFKNTRYIGTLCEVFSMHAHEHHIEDLLKIVDHKLSSSSGSNQQTTYYECRGFQRCYLHPK